MTRSQWHYRKVMIVAVCGLVTLCAGLWLAAMSNPRRFSLDPRNDGWIDLLAGTGFLCTVVGISVFVKAVSQTTTSMSPEIRNKTNSAAGMGLVLQLAGFFLPMTGLITRQAGWILVFASLPLFVWSTMNYATGKGQSKWAGLFGIAGMLGFIVLIILPDRGPSGDQAHDGSAGGIDEQ